jgi:hypothetical protein
MSNRLRNSTRNSTSTRKKARADRAQAAPEAPHRIDPLAVYSVSAAQQALNLRRSTIRRELREGRLRVSKRAGRYYLLGEWLLEWLRGGEVTRRRGSASDN